jgi:glyoxylase-like metal-dependent hydrolase (beta-lactamase superfamily II)
MPVDEGTTREDQRERAQGSEPIISSMPVGALAANCYVLVCAQTRAAAVLDPGAEVDRILARIRELNTHVTHVIHTHGHFDHISGTEALLTGLGLPRAEVRLAAHPADAFLYTQEGRAAGALFGYPVPDDPAQPDFALEDGLELAIGTLRLRVIATPGHTPGSVSVLCAPWCVFSGDTLFRRGIGRTDLLGGDEDAIYASIESRLYPLDPALVVHPGHGPPTTIGEERRLNPFVRA